ncbi:MAG: hypothetical protein ABJA57_01720 [Ginsengibacter sp.]
MRIKILLLFAISFWIIIPANSQINTGKFLLGGSFNFFSTKDAQNLQNSKSKSFHGNLQIGKAVKQNNVVGITLSYGYSKFNFFNTSDSIKSSQFGAGIFYRKYKKLIKDFYFFGELNAGYEHSNYMQTYLQNNVQGFKTVTDGAFLSFIPGISYGICNRMQIEILIPNIINVAYSHYKTDYEGNPPAFFDQKGNTFSLNANLNTNLLSNLGIGFKILLGK